MVKIFNKEAKINISIMNLHGLKIEVNPFTLFGVHYKVNVE